MHLPNTILKRDEVTKREKSMIGIEEESDETGKDKMEMHKKIRLMYQ
jgi:hypothetical protein